jgi:hypothetical protein
VKKLHLIILAILFFGAQGIAGNSAASEYKEVTVTDGGTITGKVTMEGELPPPRLFHLVLYPFGKFCEKISDGNGNRALHEFNVSKDGGLQDVVIAVQGVRKGKHFSHPTGEFHARNCAFFPFVSVIENHQKIKVVNEDPVIHNIQVYQNEKGNIILNQPLPVKSTQTGTLNFESSKKISQTICGMHEFMQNWAFVVDNPYYATTQADGRFSIDSLPPGTYTITAWHPSMQIASKTITVPARGAVKVNFEFEASEVERPEYEQQEEGRIGRNARLRDDRISGHDKDK